MNLKEHTIAYLTVSDIQAIARDMDVECDITEEDVARIADIVSSSLDLSEEIKAAVREYVEQRQQPCSLTRAAV